MWKDKIKLQLVEAIERRKIDKPLKDLVNILLKGDNEFILVYSSSRDKYIYVKIKDNLSTFTGKILILNGYKRFYLNNK